MGDRSGKLARSSTPTTITSSDSSTNSEDSSLATTAQTERNEDLAETMTTSSSSSSSLPLPQQRALPSETRDVFPPISFRLWDRYNKLRGQDDIFSCVALPQDEYVAGWVAVHLVEFWRDVASVWNVLSNDTSARLYLQRFRPGEGFPPGAVYYLEGTGGEGTARPPLMSAPAYAEATVEWIGECVADREVTRLALSRDEEDRIFRGYEKQNPRFAILSGKIIRRIFRVYGIVYCSMYRIAERMRIAPYVNEVFERFMFFCLEFDLLADNEIEPLAMLVEPIRKRFELAKNKPHLSRAVKSLCRDDSSAVCGRDAHNMIYATQKVVRMLDDWRKVSKQVASHSSTNTSEFLSAELGFSSHDGS